MSATQRVWARRGVAVVWVLWLASAVLLGELWPDLRLMGRPAYTWAIGSFMIVTGLRVVVVTMRHDTANRGDQGAI